MEIQLLNVKFSKLQRNLCVRSLSRATTVVYLLMDRLVAARLTLCKVITSLRRGLGKRQEALGLPETTVRSLNLNSIVLLLMIGRI